MIRSLTTLQNQCRLSRQWLEVDPLVSRAEHGQNYANEMENGMYQSQFNPGPSHYSNAPPPHGWSGYSSCFQENDRYPQEWNDRKMMMMPSNSMNVGSSHSHYSHYNENIGNQGNYGHSNQNGYHGIQEGNNGGPSFYQDENFNNSNFVHQSMHMNQNKAPHFHSQGNGGPRQNSMPEYMQQGGRDFRGSDTFQGNNSGSGAPQRNVVKSEPQFFPSREGLRVPDNGFNRQGPFPSRADSHHPSNNRDLSGPPEPPFFPSRETPRVTDNGFNRQAPFSSRIDSYPSSHGRDFGGPSNLPSGGPLNNHLNGGGPQSGLASGGRPLNGPNNSSGFGPSGYGPNGPMNGMSMNRRQNGPNAPRHVHNGQKGFGSNDQTPQQDSPPFGRQPMGGQTLPMDNIKGHPVMDRRGKNF